jgi:hypothetical protein
MMAKDDSESRRTRLREMREQRLNRSDTTGASERDEERVDRALPARRRASREGGSKGGERPLERFPRLREALAQRRRSGGESGDAPSPGERRRGDAPAGGQGRRRAMFAQRFRDQPQSEGGERDKGEKDNAAKLAVLEREMATLRAELDRNAEELRRLKVGKTEQQNAKEPQTSTPPTTAPQATGSDDPDSLSAWLKAEGNSGSDDSDR